MSKADAAVCVLRLTAKVEEVAPALKLVLRLTDIVWRLPLMHTKMAHTALHLNADLFGWHGSEVLGIDH